MTGHHLWLDDIDAEKDTLRALNLIDAHGYTDSMVHFRYASMPLEDFTNILEIRNSPREALPSPMSLVAFSDWSRRCLFDAIKPHFEDPLAFSLLSERIETWQHPAHGFELTVRFITGG